ncbi:MAG: argininosuccinate lyase [Magnetococcales bacterium]|nr:argininosuccinate lyase [Magnetococcales bacterium]
MSKLWGGRFAQPTDQFVEAFTASIHYDSRLYPQDIRASSVHCRMLVRQGILDAAEGEAILAGLAQVEQELAEGRLPFQIGLEDIHMHVESRLRALIGPVAGKLHTARSRNDQVATDLRLYLREQVDQLREGVHLLQTRLLELAAHHVETVMPGLTHLQNAQPVSFAHHLLAYWEMLERDWQRLGDARRRINQLPLGSAALAGTPFPVDRLWVAQELGFEGICRNSMDAVSDRDFVIELAAVCSLLMGHFSRFSEELVMWSSPLLGFVELPDGFCTGSSIMPQKKNPDVPELVRGKSGRVFGHLFSLLTLMKGLPLTYNRDMQEDKEPIFDCVDTVGGCLRVLADLVPGIVVRHGVMADAAAVGFTTATDLADYLVGKGIPFREAHEISGRLVRLCVERGCPLAQLPLQEMQRVEARIDADLLPLLTVQASVNARRSLGGTAFDTVRQALRDAWMRMGQKTAEHA